MPNLQELLKREILDQGWMTWARFMEQALYYPKLGFYEQNRRVVGREGAFMTSVSVGELFGQLLAFRFARWLENITGDQKMLIEAGAHDGRLAQDILSYLKTFEPNIYRHLRYRILEPSSTRQEWQEETLAEHLDVIEWSKDWNDMAGVKIRGVVFSNELFDSFPVHRLCWNSSRQSWEEYRVLWNGQDFAWALGPISGQTMLTNLGVEIPSDLEACLPHGFTLEIAPSVGTWWREAGKLLDAGILMTIDYGFEAMELLRPERQGGTLRGYARQCLVTNPLSHPGDVDLTCHVNFTQLEKAGKETGLVTEFYGSQTKFLTEIVGEASDNGNAFSPWNDSMTRQFQTLTHPDHFGRSFKVFVQKR